MAHLIWNRLGLGWDFNSGGVRIAFKGWSRLLVLKAIKSRVVATGAADTVQILQLYTWKNVKNHPKERFIGGTLLLGATQFNFELYLQISSVLKIKPHVQRCGSENFYLPFSFWVIFVCCAETLCSCTPWPCLSLTASAWLHIVYRGIILYSPQNSSPSHLVRRRSAPSVETPGLCSSACFSGKKEPRSRRQTVLLHSNHEFCERSMTNTVV